MYAGAGCSDTNPQVRQNAGAPSPRPAHQGSASRAPAATGRQPASAVRASRHPSPRPPPECRAARESTGVHGDVYRDVTEVVGDDLGTETARGGREPPANVSASTKTLARGLGRARVPYCAPRGIHSCSVKWPRRRGPARSGPAADVASRREDDARCAHSPLPRRSPARSAARPSSLSATSTTTCACFTTIAAPRASAPRSRFAAPPAGRPSRAAATCLLTCASAATATPKSGTRRGRRVRSACAVGLGVAAADRPPSRAKIGRGPAGRRRGPNCRSWRF